MSYTTDWMSSERTCSKCGEKLKYRIWEFSDEDGEVYEDLHFKCSCGYSFRVDGCDS